MKTKEEYIKECSKDFLPIGSKIIVKDPKNTHFYKQGIIIQYFYHSSLFVWDYLVKFDDGTTMYFDRIQVDSVH